MIYLDHASTTTISDAVRNVMTKWMDPSMVGNPSSIHTQGKRAMDAIEDARCKVARMIGSQPSEVYFTSGGTESNNAWMYALPNVSHIITDHLEHESILESSCRNAVYRSFVRSYQDGTIDLDDLDSLIGSALPSNMYALSVMWVNNEIGSVNPIKDIGAICKKHNIVFHTDAVQAAGHVPINVHECHVDALSMSAHKFGGPMGIGALYLNNEIEWSAWMRGGGQERGMRSGTQNVPGIVGMGVAAELVTENLQKWMSGWRTCRYEFISVINQLHPNFHINGAWAASPNIISITIPGVNSEALLMMLDQRGVYLSAGSACSAGNPSPSHVLTNIGLTGSDASCTVRVSMGVDTTVEEVREAAKTIAECANQIFL